MDEKMNVALVKTEKEFLMGYNMYVNQKNSEINDLVTKFKERSEHVNQRDSQIKQLEATIQDLK